jgi:hypothetical protein
MHLFSVNPQVVSESAVSHVHFLAGAPGNRMGSIRLNLGLSVVAREVFDHRPACIGTTSIIEVGYSSEIIIFECGKLIPNVADVNSLHDLLSLLDGIRSYAFGRPDP